MKASVTEEASLELTQTPANKHLIKFCSKLLRSLQKCLSVELIMGLDLCGTMAVCLQLHDGGTQMCFRKEFQDVRDNFPPHVSSTSTAFTFVRVRFNVLRLVGHFGMC